MQALWGRQTEFAENVFYDVSAWTLPLAFNLQHPPDPVKNVATAPLPSSFHTPKRADRLEESAVGYLIDWRDSAAPEMLYALLEAKANVCVATRPLTATINGKQLNFGYGTLLVAKALHEQIPDDALELLRSAAVRGVPIYPAESSSTSSGIDFGSRDFKVIDLPKVALVTGPGMNQNSAGEIWNLFDQRIRMPITQIDWSRLGGDDLSEYTHILITSDIPAFGEEAIKALRDFVEDGGSVWIQGGKAIAWAIDNELTDAVWRRTKEEIAKEEAEKKDDKPAEPYRPKERLPFAEAEDREAFSLVGGAIFDASLDTTHPIGYGYQSESLPVFHSGDRFLELSSNPYSTPIQYSKDPLLAGYISNENLELLKESASMIVDRQGEGAVVLAMDDPCFRAFWWGTQRLLVNAVFFGALLEEPTVAGERD